MEIQSDEELEHNRAVLDSPSQFRKELQRWEQEKREAVEVKERHEEESTEIVKNFDLSKLEKETEQFEQETHKLKKYLAKLNNDKISEKQKLLRAQRELKLLRAQRELKQKQNEANKKIRSLLDDRAELQAQIQDQSRVITALKKQLTLAAKEVEDMQQPQV
ncbi:cilia- and flagella- associated protein 210-like [Artemia franciscana]|uniref:cilia- and flagella- associated protein 210-like n=1 Tax=Artemia franciscana TaxID=6661 RepID=UPI0032D9ED8C